MRPGYKRPNPRVHRLSPGAIVTDCNTYCERDEADPQYAVSAYGRYLRVTTVDEEVTCKSCLGVMGR